MHDALLFVVGLISGARAVARARGILVGGLTPSG